MPEIDIHLHPMVVHFPIAFIIGALVFAAIGLLFKKEILVQTAFNLYVLAVFITPLIVATGLEEAEELHLQHPVLNWHRLFAFSVMWLALASLPLLWFIKKKLKRYFNVIFILVLVSLTILVILTAYNGGRMVYEYAVGVEH